MDKINLQLDKGLKFSARNTETERFVDLSYSAKEGALTVRKNHRNRINVGEALQDLVYFSTNGSIYSLSKTGVFREGNTVIDIGYDVNGSLLVLPPTIYSTNEYVYVLGGSKMRKYVNSQLRTWGINPPSGPGLTATPSWVEIEILNDCDSAGTWTGYGCTITDESTIKVQGSGSIKIALTAGNTGTAYTTSVSAGTTNLGAVMRVYVNAELPGNITFFTVTIIYTLNGVQYTNVADVPRSLTPSNWSHVEITENEFVPSGSEINGFYFIITSNANQNIYIDAPGLWATRNTGAVGSRYKYAYEDSVTGNRSNLSNNDSNTLTGQFSTVVLTGFVPPPAQSGADLIHIYRDTQGDGIFKSVGTLGSPYATFTDILMNNQLGEADQNRNILPPAATSGVHYLTSVWLNDVTNRRRVWRSNGVSYENFTDFFEASAQGDEVIGFIVVRGLLFILTKEHIAQVVNPDTDTPLFFNVANVGPVTNKAFYSTQDFCVIGHFTGIYIFDGANLKKLEEISTLFNPLSSDSRRVNELNINSLVLGSDNNHIWISYTQLDGNSVMFTYHVKSDKYTSESSILTAHESGDHIFGHIAGLGSGQIVDVYRGDSYPGFELILPITELEEYSHIMETSIQLTNNVNLRFDLYADGTLVAERLIPAGARRTVYLPPASTVFGKNVWVSLLPSSVGFVEMYNTILGYTKMEHTVYYDTGPVHISYDQQVITELNYTILGIISGTATLSLYVEGLLHSTYTETLVADELLTKRQTQNLPVCNSFRIIISGPVMRPLNLSVSALTLGTSELRRLEVPVR